MIRFYAATALLLAALVALTLYFRREPDSIYGIADTKEIVINSESAVDVVRLSVVEGQIVSAGDTLLALHNPELDLRINQLTHELSVLKTRESTHASLSRSELLQLRAQQQEKASEIRAELGELEAQYNLNRQLMSELRSLERDRPAATQEEDARNPIKIKIESLKRLLELAQDPSRVYQNRLSDALSSSGGPLIEQAKLLEEELKLLHQDKERLVVTSPIDGLIGSVNFKVGEKVSPFAPILTVHAASPSFARGYIHEDISSQVAVSQKVLVRSGHDRHAAVEGVIVGVGARIVEYPERLRKRPDIIIWGREIMVKIPPENRFLLGEKVRISLQGQPTGEVLGQGETRPTGGGLASPALQTPPPSQAPLSSVGIKEEMIYDIKPESVAAAGFASPAPAEVPGIEASGLVFAEDLGRFLVIDDEAKKNPGLVLVDSAGRIDATLPIEGLDAINDMEAIAVDAQGVLYVLTSQSLNKKGKLPKARTILAKVSRQGRSLKLLGQAYLRDALDAAAKAQPSETWATFIRQGIADGSLDIEGMTTDGDALLLGFKAPLLKGQAVILKLKGIAGLLSGKPLQAGDVTVFQTLDLKHHATGTLCGIADLVKTNGKFYVLSTGTLVGTASTAEKHVGELLIYAAQGGAAPGSAFGELMHRRDFEGRKAEGVAVMGVKTSGENGAVFVAIDNGSGKPSQLLKAGVIP
jgi:multidrug resistance efflux pump